MASDPTSYASDPWLGSEEKPGLQQIFWHWQIPQAWVSGPYPKSRIYVTQTGSFSMRYLQVIKEPPNAVAPRDVSLSTMEKPSTENEQWHAHLSLLAAKWGDNKNLAPVTPLTQTLLWAPATDSADGLKKVMQTDPGIQPVVELPFWNFSNAPVSKILVLSDQALIPLNSRALISAEDISLCEKAHLFLIAESINLDRVTELPPCLPDFTSGVAQTTGLSLDGESPVFLTDNWVLQTLLGGVLAHLVAINPGQPAAVYAHALRATSKDYGNQHWSFGIPQLAKASEFLLHRDDEAPSSQAPRRLTDHLLFLASVSFPIQSVRVLEQPAGSGKISCAGTALGSVRCLLAQTPSTKIKDAHFRIAIVPRQGTKYHEQTVSWHLKENLGP